MTGRVDPFSKSKVSILSLVVLTAYGWLSGVLLPILIEGYITTYKLSETWAGALGTAEIGTLSIVAFIVSPYIHLRDKRALCVIGCLLVIAGNGLSYMANGLPLLATGRIAVGAGLGLVVAATNALPTHSENSNRLYALGQLGLGIMASLLFFAAPWATERFGAKGVFVIEVGASIVALLLAPPLPSGIQTVEHQADAGRFPLNVNVLSAFAATALFFVAQTALWAFADRMGAGLSLTVETIARYLAFSCLLAIAGGAIAVCLGERLRLATPLVIGFVGVAVMGVLMYGVPSKSAFATGVLFVNFFSVFVTPYMPTILADLDRHGRVVSAGGAFTNVGCTIAPLLSGLTAAYIGYAAIGYMSAACLVIGLACGCWSAAGVMKLRVRRVDFAPSPSVRRDSYN
jgi:predicted MFS family arabinose efflux permease